MRKTRAYVNLPRMPPRHYLTALHGEETKDLVDRTTAALRIRCIFAKANVVPWLTRHASLPEHPHDIHDRQI